MASSKDATALQTLIAQTTARIEKATRENAALVVRQKAEGASFSRRANAEILRLQEETKRLTKVQEHTSNGTKAMKGARRAATSTADCIGRSANSVPCTGHTPAAANTDIRLSRRTAFSLVLVMTAIVVAPMLMFTPHPSSPAADEIGRLQRVVDEQQRVQCKLLEELAGLQPEKVLPKELIECRAIGKKRRTKKKV